VRVVAGPVGLDGDLATPAAAQGVVLFAHSSAAAVTAPATGRSPPRSAAPASPPSCSTCSPSKRKPPTASAANSASTLSCWPGRLLAAADWLAAEQRTAGLPVGLFGASTGAGAALLAAAERPETIAAVVSRGGRPDLAGAALGRVLPPTLLIVGALDPQVLELNRAALGRLGSEASLEMVPGASHLFEEPGTLEQVAELAVGWFTRWLAT
jgi:putative phosphoribosyl transferase